MKKNALLYYLFLTIIVSINYECFSQENLYAIKDINKEELINIQKKIINGDVRAYDKYKTYCMYKLNKPIDLLPYSLVMADKHSYAIACHDIAYILLHWYSVNKIKMDSSLHDMMFSYLEKGCDGKDYQCCQQLAEIYFIGDIFIPVDTSLAKYYAIQSSIYSNDKDSLSFWKSLLAMERRTQITGFPINSTQFYAIKKEE